MIGHMIRQSARRTARKTALSLGAALALTVGAAFLTVAAWIFLAAAYGNLIAALTLGLAYVGIGLILVAIAASPRDTRAADGAEFASQRANGADTEPPRPTMPPLAEAFVYGLNAGLRAEARRSD